MLFAASSANAQVDWEAAPKNLQVLPDSISSSELRSTMRGYSAELGVNYTFCHDDSNGRRLSQIDFSSDAKPEKAVARLMMKMVREINGEYVSKVSHGVIDGVPRVPVTCLTCHRGVRRPEQLAVIIAATVDSAGFDAARAKYSDLRNRHLGGMAYDFSQSSLNNLGYQLLEKGMTDEAIEVFKLNVEICPDDWNVHDCLADGYLAAHDTMRSVVFSQRSLDLNPDNTASAKRLELLK
ncbi:c-type cytochrome [Bacteroidota bacterium]